MTFQQLVLNFLAKPSKLRAAKTAPPHEKRIRADSPDTTALAESARDLLRNLGCAPLAGSVRVRWNPRMRSTAGTANYAESLITLNPRLRDISADEVIRTLKHELAHLLAKHRAGRRRISPHGAEWKRACRDLGLDDESRCHNLPLPRRQLTRRHIYRCPECKIEIKRVRPFRRRVACLACCCAHNRNRYHERFRLVKMPAPS